MLSTDDFDASFGSAPVAPCITVRIVRTEEQMSVLMQRFTAYVIEVNDFGRMKECSHRYSEFETLHKALMPFCPGLPAMPPKGADGTDSAVIAARKGELEKILRFLLASSEALMDKELNLWKFLEMGNPSVIVGRFVMVPRARPIVLKTMAKLNDDKYKDDVYRLGHSSVLDLLMEGLRETRRGGSSDSHWAVQSGGTSALCQLVAGALGTTQDARDRLLDLDVITALLGIVQTEESALDDARPALNVIVAREGERLPGIVSRFLMRGGVAQLLDLVQRPKCQEFVAKLLWLAWDASTRSAFAQPGGQGLKVLQTLLRSSTASCSLLGAVLLAGMVAGGEFQEPSHRAEALRLVTMTLERPEAAKEPTFAKTLCGGASSLVRLAAMLEDPDLAPLVLNLLCTAKPPANKLGQISGNLASLLKGSTGHSEQTRARAAELLLHIQGSGGSPTAAPVSQSMLSNGDVYSSGGYPGPGSAPRPQTQAAGSARSSINDLLERCEGIAAHEESMEAALRTQLEEGVAKGCQALEQHAMGVREVSAMSQHRLKELPALNFQSFERAMSEFKTAREALARDVKRAEGLHDTIERQLKDLQTARPSSVDPHLFKEKLLQAERLYAEVKSQREALASAEAEAREASSRSEASSSKLRSSGDAVKRYDSELQQLRTQRTQKETEAAQLRSKANMPGLMDMKQQAQENIERNLAEAKQLQVIGQRVQQGDPDYLRDGETREQKIAELTSKLAELKRQHQVLLQKQKEYDIDPVGLSDKASRLENEAAELDIRIHGLEDKLREVERTRAEASGESMRDSEDARIAKDRRSSLQARLSSMEQEVKVQLSSLQPMIQDQHSGWQRLLEKQKKLDDDQYNLVARLADSRRAAEEEARTRDNAAGAVQDLVQSLLGYASFLEQCSGDPLPVAYSAPSAAIPALAPAAPSPDPFQAETSPSCFAETSPSCFEEDFEQAAPAPTAAPAATPAPAPAAAPAPAPAPALAEPAAVAAPAAVPAAVPEAAVESTTMNDDDFDAFLKEDLTVSFGLEGREASDAGQAALAPPDDADTL
eukprot:TRINITY_DN20067_c0_g1_i2.p1 TRINITY_DN20067_c0_g1~~TRINITY_DN20067_c0_g1_i2.p1  ORF type:complete len:1055 (-),score=284.52 TRINITY_DN20067_c0_g1_i2:67-3231(-)